MSPSASATHPAVGPASATRVAELYRLLAEAAADAARARYGERQFRMGDQLFAMALRWQGQARRVAREGHGG
jgi:hypothetical protein